MRTSEGVFGTPTVGRRTEGATRTWGRCSVRGTYIAAVALYWRRGVGAMRRRGTNGRSPLCRRPVGRPPKRPGDTTSGSSALRQGELFPRVGGGPEGVVAFLPNGRGTAGAVDRALVLSCHRGQPECVWSLSWRTGTSFAGCAVSTGRCGSGGGARWLRAMVSVRRCSRDGVLDRIGRLSLREGTDLARGRALVGVFALSPHWQGTRGR